VQHTADAGGEAVVRPLRLSECEAVAAIIQSYANREILLWRTPDDIRLHAANFLVAERRGGVVGCVALQDYGGDLYELRSLAVREEHAGRGIGSALVGAAVELARARGARELFALTRRVAFFSHRGFAVVARERFPQKVWRDCVLCRKRECCDETAVVIELGGATPASG
jgi:amino-acid N-acetyltransferase